MKKILVIGGAGFIGSNLIKRLINNNKILCVDNLQTGRLKNLNDFNNNDNFKFVSHDITEIDFIKTIVNEIVEFFDAELDEIYNLACPASPPKYQINPLHTLRTSLAIDSLCGLASMYNAKILHTSTSEVYGNPIIPIQTETYSGNVNCIGPRSCYDEGKRCAETFLYEWHKLGIRAKIIRIFNTYGPKMDPEDGRVISNFVCQALRNEDITIYGDGSQTRSFQYIDDLINGIIKVMRTDDNVLGPFNLGNPEEFTIKELAEKVIEKIDTKSKIVYKDLPTDDPIQRCPDITKAKMALNWEPKTKLNEGLDLTIDYFRNEIL